MRWGTVCILLVAACSGSDDGELTSSDGVTDGTSPELPTGETGLEPTEAPRVLEASCTAQEDNVLRFVCDVHVEPAQPVQVRFAPADGSLEERVHTSEAVAEDHQVGLYFMKPDSLYDWSAEAVAYPGAPEVTGTVTTGIPPESAWVAVEAEGTSSTPQIGFASPCTDGADAMIATTDGDLLWYQDLSNPQTQLSFVEGVSFTEDGTVLGVVSDSVVETDLMGNELLRLHRGADFEEHVHHDSFRKDGLTYVVFQETVHHDGFDYLLDGFYVFDETGTLVQEWHLFDHFQPVGWGGDFLSSDYSHANGVWVDDDGYAYVSFRHLSAVAKVVADPAAPDFGEITWRLSGDPFDPDFGSDFALTSTGDISPTFQKQHNVHFLPDGRLTMFDNRTSWVDVSRLLVLTLDETSWTANIDEEYALPVHCDFQGGAWHTAAGNPLATCAPSREGYEFDVGVYDSWRYHVELDCFGGFQSYVPRIVPLDW